MSFCTNEIGTELYKDESVSSQIIEEILSLKNDLKDSILILGHHYQQDEIIHCSDKIGDSYELSKYAAKCTDKKYIVFCGVHFMAETADIVTSDDQVVVLPDLNAGCSMADMADIEEVEEAFEEINSKTAEKVIPITYMNSTAAIKSFVGKNDGLVCTSSNAQKAFEWAFERGTKIFFIPDEHLGRNTAHQMGITHDEMVLLNRKSPFINQSDLKNIKIILWKGHCSVHMNFRPAHVDMMREKFPSVKIIVHPECEFDVVNKSDYVGSTSYIIKTIENTDEINRWAVGTEHHLVNRLAKKIPEKKITSLAPFTCQCATMYRISPEALLNSLRKIKSGNIENIIRVDSEVKKFAKIALERMLEI